MRNDFRYPEIKLGGRVSNINSFVNMLNSAMARSPTLQTYLLLYGNNLGLKLNLVYGLPRNANGNASWYGMETGNGLIKDNPFSTYDATINLNLANFVNLSSNTIDYTRMMVTLAHELSHPWLGKHAWDTGRAINRFPASEQQVLNDGPTQVGVSVREEMKIGLKVWDNHTGDDGLTSGQIVVSTRSFPTAAIGSTVTVDGVQATVVSSATFARLDAEIRYKAGSLQRASKFFGLSSKFTGLPNEIAAADESYIFMGEKLSPEDERRLVELARSQLYAQVGDITGSSLGKYLASGNVYKGIVYSSLLGEIGERFGAALAAGSGEGAIRAATDDGLAAFGTDVAVRAAQAGIGAVSSWLSMELGEALGLDGFGAELFETVGSQVTTTAINNLLNHSPIFKGFITKVTGGGKPTSAGAGLANAVGSFLGAKLGAMVVSPTTQAGVALSSIGAAVGSYLAVQGIGIIGSTAAAIAGAGSSFFSGAAAQAIFNTIAPGVGAFIGFVLGALIGNLFGRKKPKIPSANAETVLQIPFARYELGAVTVVNNGNRSLVTSMAAAARDTLNGLISMIAYTNTTAYVNNLNGVATTQTYGHTANQIWVKINGVQSNFASADAAVEYGALTAIRNTKIVGGDIFAKRVIAKSLAADLTSLSGDLQIASDYRFYANNRALVNGFITGAYAALTEAEQSYYATNKALIDKAQTQGTAALTSDEFSTYNANKATIDKIIGALENQALANPWIITLQRVSELGLDKWTPSDFYGGLRGFLDSFDLKGHGTTYENVRIHATGGGAEIQARSADSDGLFSLLPQAKDGPGDNDILNARFDNSLQGWDMATWQVANPQRGVNLNADWSGSGNDVFWTHMPGTPAAGSVIDVRSALMVSIAGVTYEASVKAANHRGLAQMYVEFYDANMNHLGSTYMSGQGLEGGSWHGDLANYNTISGTVTAPPGTAYRRMVLRLVATGAEAPFGFFTQPTSRVANAAISDWTAEGEIVSIDDMTKVGYTLTNPGATTSGNDFVDQRLATGSVTIDDTHAVYVEDGYYRWNDWDGYDWIDTSYWTTGDGGDDIFVGGASGDYLYGRSGWDWLDGRSGNDYLDGGDGNDTLIGRDGEDTLIGGAGDDYLSGGQGTDSLDGGAGNDILADFVGSEVLQGGDGDDTFLIAEDATFNWFWGGYADPNSDPNGKDTISAERLAFGVAFDLDYRPPEWNGHPDATAGNPISRMAVITNAVTGAWVTNEGLLSIENATGSDYDDRLYGTTGDNVLKGLVGADQLWGRDGNDTIEGGVGADIMDGGGGYDWLSYVGSSAGVYVDLSTGEAFGGDAEGDVFSGFEAVRGSKAADQLKGYDGGDNWLDGEAGDDWLIATTGADVFVGGEGKDFVDYSAATGGITLNLGGYTASSVVTGYGSGGLASSQAYIGVEGVVGSDFADSMTAGDGDQTFVGGKGNDVLQGGAGADTYVLNRGDGSDIVYEDNLGWNTFSFGGNITVDDLWIGAAGGASGWLDIGIRGTGDVIRMVAFTGAYPIQGNNKLKSVDMNGAGQLDVAAIEYAMAGDDNANLSLYGGSNRADLIFGYSGNDTIYGAASGQMETKGNVIVAGWGNDVIYTSGGDDQFAYDRARDANGAVVANIDTIYDTGGEDTIVFGSTIEAEDVIYEVVGDDLYVGARDLTNTALTASQVVDRIRIVGGSVKYVVMDGYSNTVMYESLNTVEYVLAGGTSIDLRKLDIAWTQSITYNYDYAYPIALDLDGDGLDLSTVESSSVVVKTAGGGISQIGWVGPTDGFLAVDRNGDGAINQLSELSFVQDKPGATSDLEGLRTWDSNGDGLLDKNDKDFSKILLFVDANQNGRSTAKELRTLEQAGIAAINLGGLATGQTRDQTTESFVQNTISFIWADGRTGEGYDVALARRVLGSNGLDGGAYQAEWGAADEDGELGQLTNDAKTAAQAARIKVKKALLDQLGASYGEVKAAAQLDFSDHDRVDATIAQRWTKMSASEKASWLTGQQPAGKVRLISTQQALANDLNAAAKARQGVVEKGYAQAARSVSATGLAQTGGQGASAADPAGLGVSFGSAGLGLSLAGGEPLDAGSAYGGAGQSSGAWWRQEAGSDLLGGGSLAARLAAMDAGPGQGSGLAASGALDASLVQNQALLRQAMAGFGGQASGGAAVWSRDGASRETPLAASAGLKATQSLLTA